MMHKDFDSFSECKGLFFSDEIVEAFTRTGIEGVRGIQDRIRRERGHHHLFQLQWIHLAASAWGRREGSYKSTNHVIESLKNHLTNGGVLLPDNVASHHSPCVQAFAESIGIELISFPPYYP